MARRKVHFYRAFAGLNAGGRPIAFDHRPLLGHICGLAFDPEGRYLEDDDGNALCGWPDGTRPHRRFALGMIRRSELPDVERRGALRPLAIPADSGIVEQTQFVFFPHNIVGALYNFYGPRPSRLRSYFGRKCPEVPESLRFDPLVRADILEQLDRAEHVRVLKLGIRKSFVDQVAAADEGLGNAFRASLEASEAEEAELILKPRPRRKTMLRDSLLRPIRALARSHDLQEEVRTFEIQAADEAGDLEWIDILKSRFTVEVDVALQERRRTVDPHAGYAAIEGAYEDNEQQLIRAVAIL